MMAAALGNFENRLYKVQQTIRYSVGHVTVVNWMTLSM